MQCVFATAIFMEPKGIGGLRHGVSVLPIDFTEVYFYFRYDNSY